MMSEHDKTENEAINDLIARLRAPVTPRADFADRVMAQVERTEIDEPLTNRVVRDVPRSKYPYGRIGVYALAGACVMAGVMVWRFGAAGSKGSNAALQNYVLEETVAPSVIPVQQGAERVRMVRFEIVAPEASEVSLAGSFNGWQVGATQMARVDTRGTWYVDVPLEVGRHTYMFVIDKVKWVSDPKTTQEVNGDFGESNSVITVSAEDAL